MQNPCHRYHGDKELSSAATISYFFGVVDPVNVCTFQHTLPAHFLSLSCSISIEHNNKKRNARYGSIVILSPLRLKLTRCRHEPNLIQSITHSWQISAAAPLFFKILYKGLPDKKKKRRMKELLLGGRLKSDAVTHFFYIFTF
jgi:hypothetical protein